MQKLQYYKLLSVHCFAMQLRQMNFQQMNPIYLLLPKSERKHLDLRPLVRLHSIYLAVQIL